MKTSLPAFKKQKVSRSNSHATIQAGLADSARGQGSDEAESNELTVERSSEIQEV